MESLCLLNTSLLSLLIWIIYRKTFENIESRIKEIEKYCREPVVILIGNKNGKNLLIIDMLIRIY